MKFETLKHIISNIPGMSNADNLSDLIKAAEDTFHLDGDILEIGTWCGRSAIPLAYVAAEFGCKLHCYDIWPPVAYWEQLEINPVIMAQIRGVYKRGGPLATFEKAIKEHKLQDVIIAHPISFTYHPDMKFRFAFIDGSHLYENVRLDIAEVTQCLVNSGTLIVDDMQHSYPGVQKAFHEALGYTRKRRLNLKMGIAERKV